MSKGFVQEEAFYLTLPVAAQERYKKKNTSPNRKVAVNR